MADQRPQSLQNVFLEHVRSRSVPVTIFLVNGVKLQGCITYFDTYSIELTRAGESQMIYKQAVSTILPAGPVQLSNGE
jgi:host factor-I protein